MTVVRVGILGCARIAERSVAPAIVECPATELVAVASRTEAKAAAFAQAFGCDAVVGYDRLLAREDIDAIYVPLPTGLHGEWVRKGILAGKHLLVEKAFAMNISETEALLELAADRKRVLMETFQFRFHSQVETLLQMVNAGEIGELRLIRSSFGFPPLPPDDFRYDPVLGGGALYDAGGYPLRIATLVHPQPMRVAGATWLMDAQRGVDIAGSAMLVGDDGVGAQLAWGFDHFYQCNVELWGSKGRLTAHRIFTAPPDLQPRLTVEKQGEANDVTVSECDAFKAMVSEFARCITQGERHREAEHIVRQSRGLSEIRQACTMGGVS